MKKCPKCKGPHDGNNSWCKQCVRDRAKESKRTPEGRIRSMYNAQVTNAKFNGRKPPTYTKQQLVGKLMSMDLYHEIHAAWAASGYLKALGPSIDRDDNTKSYESGNITLMTWEQNEANARADNRSGKLRTVIPHKAVDQFDLDGNFIARFISIKNASRHTGISCSVISKIAHGKTKKPRTFMFKFS